MDNDSSVKRLQTELDRASQKGGSSVLNAFGPSVEAKQARIVRNFTVPSDETDLLDFMTTCKSRGNRMYKGHANNLYGAYYEKYLECYEKAKTLYSNNPRFEGLLKEAEKEKKKIPAWVWGVIPMAVFMIILIICMATCERPQ